MVSSGGGLLSLGARYWVTMFAVILYFSNVLSLSRFVKQDAEEFSRDFKEL